MVSIFPSGLCMPIWCEIDFAVSCVGTYVLHCEIYMPIQYEDSLTYTYNIVIIVVELYMALTWKLFAKYLYSVTCNIADVSSRIYTYIPIYAPQNLPYSVMEIFVIDTAQYTIS